MSTFTRALGAATLGFGVAILVRPSLLARPCRMTDSRGGTSWQAATLIRALGARDAASGAAIMLAPSSRPLQLALALRALADAGDAVTFGPVVPAAARKKVVVVAGGWSALNLAALVRELASTPRGRQTA